MSRLWEKGLILVVLSVFLINIPVLAQENCQLAIPRYGVVQCQSTSSDEYPILKFSCSGNQCSTSFTCISNCEISSPNEIKIYCGSLQASVWKVYKNSVLVTEKSIFGGGTFPIKFNRGDTISVDAYCTQLVTNYQVQSTSQIEIQQLLILLSEGWAGSLPTAPIQGTEGCTLNKVIDKYKGESQVQTFLNPITGNLDSKPSSTYENINQLPTNWKVGDTYIFVKDWQTGIADISLTYDKQKRPYWCGGQIGNRKIYNVNNIMSANGICYSLPTSIALQNVECCFPVDCLSKDPSGKLTCNPDTWKCEETKSCNSNVECQQTFGTGICQNNQVINWFCDTNKKWGNYIGTCVKQIKTVIQCQSDCTANEYYNEDEGICKSRVTILDCPSGKCCKPGGNYKEKNCDVGLECCSTTDSLLGECKSSCSPPPQTVQHKPESGNIGITAQAVGTESNNSFVIILVLVLAGAVIASYFLFIRKPKTSKALPKVQSQGKFCTKCGSSIKGNSKFCTKCGKQV